MSCDIRIGAHHVEHRLRDGSELERVLVDEQELLLDADRGLDPNAKLLIPASSADTATTAEDEGRETSE